MSEKVSRKQWWVALWRIQSFHHCRHWDYTCSEFLRMVGVVLLVYELIWLGRHFGDTIAIRGAALGLGLFAGTFILAMGATGWVIHTTEKYRHEISEEARAIQGIR